MIFTMPRANLYVSDAGFSVEVLGRSSIQYMENNHSVRISSEILDGPAGMAIFTRSMKQWEPPYENEQIDEATKSRIIENIRAAFQFQGYDINVY